MGKKCSPCMCHEFLLQLRFRGSCLVNSDTYNIYITGVHFISAVSRLRKSKRERQKRSAIYLLFTGTQTIVKNC